MILPKVAVVEIEEAITGEVLKSLKKGEPISFPDLEKEVSTNLNLKGYSLTIRQIAWRLIGNHQVELLKDLKIKWRNNHVSNNF